MLTHDHHRRDEPAGDQHQVHRDEHLRRVADEVAAREHRERREAVAEADEDRVDGGLALELHLGARGQPEHLARGLVQRVVGGLLRHLHPLEDRERGREGNHRRREQREDRQREDDRREAAALQETRRQEQLRAERREIGPEVEVAVEGRRRARARQRGRGVEAAPRAAGDAVLHDLEEQVLAVGRGPAEQEGEDARREHEAVADDAAEARGTGRRGCERAARSFGRESVPGPQFVEE